LRVPFLRKSKLVARKEGDYAEKASAGKEIASETPLCFRRKRRARGRSTGSPLRGFNPRIWFWRCARPAQEMECASSFLRVIPFLPGRATPKIRSRSGLNGEKLQWARPPEPLFFCEFKIQWNHRWGSGIILYLSARRPSSGKSRKCPS